MQVAREARGPAPEPRPLSVVGSSAAASSGLPEMLRAYRRAAGLTGKQAAALVGGCHTAWNNWERGRVPSPRFLLRLADLLGITPDEARALAGPDRVRRPTATVGPNACVLARWRLAAGLSSAELARRMCVDASLVSRWERGQTAPGHRYWPALAAVVGVPIDEVEAAFQDCRAPSDTVCVQALAEVRQDSGVTQRQLAERIGVDVSSIQRWERLATAPRDRAVRIAAALHVRLDDLARPSQRRRVVRPIRPMPLRQLRTRTGLPARVVAARVKVRVPTLLAWERGERRPSPAHARALARTLHAPAEQVFAAVGLPLPTHIVGADWTQLPSGRALRELRTWEGLTQQRLASAVGVRVATLRAWESGRNLPRRSSRERLLAIIRMPSAM